MNSKKRVLLLCGGRSPEHPVSVNTARKVLEAIDQNLYEVFVVGITRAGQWVYVSGQRFDEFLERDADGLEYVKPSKRTAYLLPLSQGVRHAALLQTYFRPTMEESAIKFEGIAAVDVVFPLLHGPYGEDGIVQGFLETLDVAYVGSGVLASAVGMDKQFMKIMFKAAGIQVSPYICIPAPEYNRSRQEVLDKLRDLKPPIFVKPARAGSSFGITRVDDFSELEAAMVRAYRFDTKAIVEEGVVGQEIEVAVLQGRGGRGPRVTVPGEIIVQGPDKTYDFNSKYLGNQKTRLLIPARLEEDVAAAIQNQAKKAFEAIEARGLSRVDFFYSGDGRIVINEINTMPGFTEISMYPKLWEASGISYSALISELIALALEK